jgi:hypothetical protein
MPAQSGKDQESWGWVSCKSEFVRSILDDHELSSTYLCGQNGTWKMHAFRCVVGLVMNWVDLIAPKVIFI